MRLGLTIAALLLVAGTAPAPAAHWWEAGPPLPVFAGRVTDEARLLSPAVAGQIGRRLARLEAATGHQFVVLTVSSLRGQRIEDFGIRVGRSWAIGRKGINDGVLLIVAPNERRVRIEVGYGLETPLSDPVCAKIIRETILPRFRKGEMAEGIGAGVDAVIARIDE
ncbi:MULTISPECIES: TPM domain-containing protein [unclassified Sphingomonas]|uniref:TPM domain-containing protein n=1 Tax=unclassified Sphingomonas TaxID=196159 RepID=UPI0006F28A82|nr:MULTISPECIES: TPM domain-containing protein [unclassified Sphingomonas]KQX26243.1 permease [Sphingomonas sp. Root1294]KQY69312.1 permease [Sphingomonas sp. Root50]KRB89570.1 permease [Sphingomonas sp. Root720]